MKIAPYLFVMIALTNTIPLSGSTCSGEMFTITELLNHDLNDYHIFTCKILGTYKRGLTDESVAVVQRRFKGNPNDTIFIATGGIEGIGSRRLNTKSEWLIFSRNKDRLNYGAMVCDFLSAKIKKGDISECERDLSSVGKMYLEILELYEKIKKEQYTGNVEISGDGKLAARGNFTSGVPDGDWIHYSRRNNFDKNIVKSKITYKNGMLHGKYDLYHEVNGQNVLIQKRMYKNDLPELVEFYDGRLDWCYYREKYTYKNDRERVVVSTSFDSTGVKIRQHSSFTTDYNSERYERLSFWHGAYFNKSSKDSSSYTPLATGKYFRGARVGKWEFFNKKGETVATKVYPEIAVDEPYFLIYDESGNVQLQGRYNDKKRTGTWKYFYDNKLQREELYNSNGDKIYRKQSYGSGRMTLIPYQDNQKHGRQITFNNEHKISSIEHYAAGRKHGLSIFYNQDGTISKESNYIDNREFTISNEKHNGRVINGFLHGYVVHYSGKTGEKVREGAYWYGYKTGVWMEYATNGTYLKKYYPTDPEKLMNSCNFLPVVRTEQYDKEGKLLRSWED